MASSSLAPRTPHTQTGSVRHLSESVTSSSVGHVCFLVCMFCLWTQLLIMKGVDGVGLILGRHHLLSYHTFHIKPVEGEGKMGTTKTITQQSTQPCKHSKQKLLTDNLFPTFGSL